jgi:GT2 family glycosyltransferase
MTKVNIGSMFRDSQVWHNRYIGQVGRFFNQLDSQKSFDQYKIDKIIVCEGNSQDDTWEVLQKENEVRHNLQLMKRDTAKIPVQSTGVTGRVAEIAKIANEVLEQLADSDYIIWQESDLIILNEYLLLTMLDNFSKIDNLGIVAPIIFGETHHHIFYDTFIFRTLEDIRWQNYHPWAPNYYEYDRYIPMNSVGSMAMIKSEIVREGGRFGPVEGFVDLCRKCREMGLTVYADKSIHIYHPFKHGIVEGRAV